MKIKITFKTPDAVDDALEQEFATNYEEDSPSDRDEERVEEMKETARNTIEKFVRCGEYITVEFDTDNDTATVLRT